MVYLMITSKEGTTVETRNAAAINARILDKLYADYFRMPTTPRLPQPSRLALTPCRRRAAAVTMTQKYGWHKNRNSVRCFFYRHLSSEAGLREIRNRWPHKRWASPLYFYLRTFTRFTLTVSMAFLHKESSVWQDIKMLKQELHASKFRIVESFQVSAWPTGLT